MDPTTGQAYPCPNCGSRSVRWRNRRVYDVLFTWLRYSVDALLSMILVRKPTPLSTSPYSTDRAVRSQALAREYAMRRAAYEAKVGLETATHFWRCPDCKQKGQVFSGLDEVLAMDRADLASMEDKVVSNLGGVSSRVDRDGLAED